MKIKFMMLSVVIAIAVMICVNVSINNKNEIDIQLMYMKYPVNIYRSVVAKWYKSPSAVMSNCVLDVGVSGPAASSHNSEQVIRIICILFAQDSALKSLLLNNIGCHVDCELILDAITRRYLYDYPRVFKTLNENVYALEFIAPYVRSDFEYRTLNKKIGDPGLDSFLLSETILTVQAKSVHWIIKPINQTR